MASIATIGFFDGVHLGHLSLLRQLRTQADHLQLSALIITFPVHPRIYTEGVTPALLLTHDQRLERLYQAGADRVIEIDFEQIQHLTAQAFMQFLREQYQVQALLMGYDHRFGADRMSRFTDYQQAGAQAGVAVYQAQQAEEGAISSTKIRRALQEGRLDEANRYLGYDYTLTGEVVHGQHIGTRLGFPTANLQSPIHNPQSTLLLPKPGVYAAIALGRKALVNIGSNPTFGNSLATTVEVHIPHYEADLYGQTLSVHLIAYIREDQRFENEQALINQIHQDIEHLDHLLA